MKNLPWSVESTVIRDAPGSIVAFTHHPFEVNDPHPNAVENAALIVRAVNSHQSLVDALTLLLTRGYKIEASDYATCEAALALALAKS